jgi:hypothetical protein
VTATPARSCGRNLIVLVALLPLLVLGGCRDADRVARSPVPAALLSADPLGGPEASLDAVERAVEADPDTPGGR